MHVRTVLWDLTDSPMTIASLREYLRDEAVDAFGAVAGLRLKVWVSNDETNVWGATYVWDSRAAMDAAQPKCTSHRQKRTRADATSRSTGCFTIRLTTK